MPDMAEIVDDNAWSVYSARSRDFPVTLWADGKTRILTRGTDFVGTTANARNSILQAARRRGVRLATRIIDETRIMVRKA